MTLTISDPKETAPTDSNEGPIRAILEDMEAKKRTEKSEEKEKRKLEEKRAEEDEVARLEIKKKEKKRSKRKQRRREEKRLRKKEERRKRAESMDVDGESTTARVEVGVSTQVNPSTQQQASWLQSRLVTSDDKEDPDISYLIRRRKENAPQGSTRDPTIYQRIEKKKEKKK
ncbi:protein PXR1-like [Benincasa hispida]|uniref:protein PXR1-like n=1 Tax=Benincasa hispida TaxID=102211 RepID=UPI0019029B41|nr:protein PXR1-like [Benincasa hispida]